MSDAQSTRSASVRSESDVYRAVWNTVKGSMGNLVEWFDVYTYTTFAAYFEDQFFSPDDPHKSIYIYAIFWATFIMRPFGSWFFGRWADRHGRRSALIMAVTIMAVSSLVISVLPTRGTIGVGAPILLLICRIVQGFATGGEYGTSATYMSEASTKGHRGFLLLVPVLHPRGWFSDSPGRPTPAVLPHE